MANPQKENGYTPIANELFDAIVHFRIPGELRQIFDAVMRKTYGFNKKEDDIANSQLVILTGMKKGNISRALSKLITHKLVIRSDNNSPNGIKLKINKDYSEWIKFGIKSDNTKKAKKELSKVKPKLSEVITKVIISDNKVLSEVMDTKDKRHSKDNIQKTGETAIAVSEPQKTPKEFAKLFFDGIEKLMAKTEPVPWLSEFLVKLTEKYGVTKARLWEEVKNFGYWWTERNSMGTRAKWEMQKTFEVDRRLRTWFDRANMLKKDPVQPIINKGKGITSKKTLNK